MRHHKVQMSKKKRPNRTVAVAAVPAAPPPSPVMHNDVFRSFVDEARSIGLEVEARRAFQNEVASFLAEKKLVQEFEAWRAARKS